MQDLVLGRRVVAHDAARVYDNAPAGKNKVLHWRHAITDYLMEVLWMVPYVNYLYLKEIWSIVAFYKSFLAPLWPRPAMATLLIDRIKM